MDEFQELEQRPGEEPEHAPVHGLVEAGDAEGGLIGLQDRHGLGATEEALGLGDLAAWIDRAGGAHIVGLEDVDAAGLGDAKLALDSLVLGGDQRGQPILVCDPGPAAGGGDGGAAVLGPLLELDQPQLFAQPADRTLVDDGVRADIAGHALALHRAVGRQGHGAGPGVGHGVGDGEHEAVVHRDLPGEGQARAVGGLQGDGRARRQGRARCLGPDGGGGGQARYIGPGPAELRELGVLGALRPQQLHRRRVLGHGLAVLLEIEIVETGATQGDRTRQGRCFDPHPGAGGGGGLAGNQGFGGGGRRLGEVLGLDLGAGGRRVAGQFGFTGLGARAHDQELVGQQQRHRRDHEDNRVAVRVVLHGARAQTEGGEARSGARVSLSAPRLISALFTSSSKRAQGRVGAPPRAMNT